MISFLNIDAQFNLFKKEKISFQIFFIMLIILFGYSIIIPQIYSYSEYQGLQYENLFLLSICSTMLIICNLTIFNFNKDNLITDNLRKIIIQRRLINSASIQNEDQSNIDQMLECKSELYFLSIQMNNPETFLNNYIDCLKQQIYLSLKDILSNDKINILAKSISNLNKFNEKMTLIDKKDFKKYMDKLRKQFLKSIVHSDNNIYYKLMENLESFKNIYLQIKQKQLKQSKNVQIENFESFLKIKSTNLNSNNNVILKDDSTKQFQEQSQIYKFIENHNLINKYNIYYDNILGTSQYESIGENNLILDKNYTSFKTIDIFNIIEQKLGIDRMKTNNNDYTCKFNSFDFEFMARQASDKLQTTILDKIQRKISDHSISNTPQFQQLIKDFKRMSLVFEKLDDLNIFISQMQNIFGKKFNKVLLAEDWKFQVTEIKNGFEKMKISDNEQKDLKIILEMQNLKGDVSMFLEIQLNLNILMKYKVVDHIFQEFERSNVNIQETEQNLSLQEFHESNLRIFYLILKQIIMFIAFSLIIVSLTLTIQHQIINIKKIECQNGNYRCFNYCINKITLNNSNIDMDTSNQDECVFYFKKQIKFLSSKDQFVYSSHFQFIENDIKDYSIHLHDNLNLKICNNQDNFCLYSNKINQCLDQYSETYNAQHESIKYSTDGQNYVFIDKNKKFNLSYSKFTELNDIILNVEVKDQFMYQDRICILTEQKLLYCTEYYQTLIKQRKDFSNDISLHDNGFIQSNNYFIQELSQNVIDFSLSQNILCVIKKSLNVKCKYLNIIEDQPNENFTSIRMIDCGRFHSCMITLNNETSCFGFNTNGEVDVPTGQMNNFQTIKVGLNISCGILTPNSILLCWGMVLIDRNFEYNYGLLMIDVQMHYQYLFNGIEMIQVTINNDNQELEYYNFNVSGDLMMFESQDNNNFCQIDVNQNLQCVEEVPKEFQKSRQIQVQFHERCAINIQGLTKCWYNYNTNGQNEQKYSQNLIEKLMIENVDYASQQFSDTIIQKVDSQIYHKLNNNVPQLSKQEGDQDHIIDFQLFTCQFKLNQSNVTCIQKLQQNFLERLDFELGIKIKDIKIGFSLLCIHFQDLSLKCYDEFFNQVQIYLLENIEVFKFNLNRLRLCVLNFQMKILCLNQFDYSKFSIQQDIEYEQLI